MINYVISKKDSKKELFVVSVESGRLSETTATFSTPERKEILVSIEDFVSTLLKSFQTTVLEATFNDFKKFVVGYRLEDDALYSAVKLNDEEVRTMYVKGKPIIADRKMDAFFIKNDCTISLSEAAHMIMAAVAMGKLNGIDSISDIFSYEPTVVSSYCEVLEKSEITKGNGWYRI